MLANIFQPTPTQRIWEWADLHFRIPQIVGSPNPGEFDSGQMPFWRGVFDLLQQPKVRHLSIRKSARVGGSLFSMISVCHKIATKPGSILWVDPSRKTAVRLSRNEVEHFLLACKPVKELAVVDRQNWTTLERTFAGCTFGMVGAGSAAELAGRQAEMLVLNETDKLTHDVGAEAPAHELAIARTKQFAHTKKIIENSTPTLEWGRANQAFLKGSQHYVYVPCPHCGVQQRLTFFSEEKEVPFDMDGQPLPNGKTRMEKTGRFKFDHLRSEHKAWDIDKVERETVYECAHCEKEITQDKLPWMNRRYELRAHNPNAPHDMKSVHVWGAHSPFELWGATAKKFLLSKGSVGKMHDFFNSDLGLPFVRRASEIKDTDIDRIISRSPNYQLGQIPKKPLMLTMTIDVQQASFWWSIWAWGVIEDLPDKPSWTALVDYGQAGSYGVLEEQAGIADNGKLYEFEGEQYRVNIGLIDSGAFAKSNHQVYKWALKNRDVFHPYKGGGWTLMRGKTVRLSEIEWEGDIIQQVQGDDDIAKQTLYYSAMKDERENWWLPRNVGEDFRSQHMAERTVEKKNTDGTIKLEWVVEGEQGNHLADCSKYNLILREFIEESEAFIAAREDQGLTEDS